MILLVRRKGKIICFFRLESYKQILEFDTEQSAVIMPGHHSDYNFPQKAVMLFMEPEIDDFAAHNECEIVAG